ncbi:MAG: class I SAM-dependent methyltransferase [Erythrobacter sp.]
MDTPVIEQNGHELLVIGDHDELMRQHFSQSLKRFTQNSLLPGLTPVFEGRASQAFKKEHGRNPEDRRDIRKAMVIDPYFQAYASTNRIAQEMIWDSVREPLVKAQQALNDRARSLSEQAQGTLDLPEDFDVPRYVTAIDIHCMPGGYASQTEAEDASMGALYDRGVFLYSMGMMGPDNDDMGRSVCNYVKRHFPDFSPQDILDLGCTVGHSTLPFKQEFPEANVTGIDVAGPCVRYAHARAAAMGCEVNFAQQNAEATDFEGGSFDLIVSHILLHETSGKAMPEVFNECFRLLKSGGIMIHADLPPFEKMGPFMQFIIDNETYYNNEPFWGAMREVDQVQLAIDAGFPKGTVKFDNAPMAMVEQMGLPPVEAEDREFVAGEYAPGGGWEVLIARKPA